MHLVLEDEIRKAISHPLTEYSCFVCGTDLTESNTTLEHVIPKWVQRRYDLANEMLTLLNGTDIRYHQLTVPCCKGCNGTHLAQLERKVQSAVDQGFEALQALPEGFLYQWLVKIYLGLLYKELFLSSDRANPDEGSIVDPNRLENLRFLWFWLRQSFNKRNAMRAPGSVWIFRCLIPPPHIDGPFDLQDDLIADTITIRLGQVGIIADLLDCRVHQKAIAPIIRDLQRLRLAQNQFIELATRIFYYAWLLGLCTKVRVIISVDSEERLLIQPESTVSGNRLFCEWNEERYAELLAQRTGLHLGQVLLPDGKARSWIYSSDSQLAQWEYT